MEFSHLSRHLPGPCTLRGPCVRRARYAARDTALCSPRSLLRLLLARGNVRSYEWVTPFYLAVHIGYETWLLHGRGLDWIHKRLHHL
ncbi:hypothetical protein BDV10DRAFT_166980 [Aspergillus recurvatus]